MSNDDAWRAEPALRHCARASRDALRADGHRCWSTPLLRARASMLRGLSAGGDVTRRDNTVNFVSPMGHLRATEVANLRAEIYIREWRCRLNC